MTFRYNLITMLGSIHVTKVFVLLMWATNMYCVCEVTSTFYSHVSTSSFLFDNVSSVSMDTLISSSPSSFSSVTSSSSPTSSGGCCQSHVAAKSDIYSVLDEIFDGYRPEARPVKSSTLQTTVNVSFTLISLIQIDEKQQTMSHTIHLTLKWTDEHLAWDASKHGGLDRISIPQSMVWLPNIVVSPFVGKMEPLGYDDQHLMVQSNGVITWEPSGLFTTHCSMDITFYPFDKQFCILRLELWSSINKSGWTKDSILRLDKRHPLYFEPMAENSEWEVLAVVPVEGLVNATEDDVQSQVELRFILRRRPMFVSLTIVLPTVLLALLSCLVFAVPAESGEKMSVSVTVFLTLVLSLSVIINVLPQSALQVVIASIKVSVHVTYLAMLATCSSLGVVLSLYVHHLRNRQYPKGLRSSFISREIEPVGSRWRRLVLTVRSYQEGRVMESFGGYLRDCVIRKLCRRRYRSGRVRISFPEDTSVEAPKDNREFSSSAPRRQQDTDYGIKTLEKNSNGCMFVKCKINCSGLHCTEAPIVTPLTPCSQQHDVQDCQSLTMEAIGVNSKSPRTQSCQQHWLSHCSCCLDFKKKLMHVHNACDSLSCCPAGNDVDKVSTVISESTDTEVEMRGVINPSTTTPRTSDRCVPGTDLKQSPSETKRVGKCRPISKKGPRLLTAYLVPKERNVGTLTTSARNSHKNWSKNGVSKQSQEVTLDRLQTQRHDDPSYKINNAGVEDGTNQKNAQKALSTTTELETNHQILNFAQTTSKAEKCKTREISWVEVAESLDFALLRIFLYVVSIVTVLCTGTMIRQFYDDGEHHKWLTY